MVRIPSIYIRLDAEKQPISKDIKMQHQIIYKINFLTSVKQPTIRRPLDHQIIQNYSIC